MAVKSVNGVTTLSPSSMRWLLGAIFVFLIPGFGIFAIIALVYLVLNAGFFQRLRLTPNGLIHSKWSSTKHYAWSDISDFRVQKIRTGILSSSSMVTFTHDVADDSFLGTTAKFLSGGTHSVPTFGMKPAQLVLLMQAYKAGHVPSDTVTQKTNAISAALPVAASLLANSNNKTSDQQSQAARKIEPTRPDVRPDASPRPKPMRTLKPIAARKHKTSTPLVQEGGGLFGRRRSDSPFRS
ncbi:MAG: hypothetical protein AAF642_07410 [Pseudomonadota bacterium]